MQVRNGMRSVAGFSLLVAVLAGSVAAQSAPNDNCDGAWPLALGQTPGTNEGSTTSPGGVSCATIGKDVWYTLVTPDDGLLTISTIIGAGAGGAAGAADAGAVNAGGTDSIDTVLTVYSGSCGALVPLACSDDASVFTLQSQVELFVTSGQTLFVRVGGFLGDLGDFVLTTTLVDVAPVVNDDCSNALPLYEGVTTGSTLGATNSVAPSGCLPPSSDVWFSYVASGTGLLSISTADGGESTQFFALLTAYTGACGMLTEVGCGTAFGSAGGLDIGVFAGQQYLIRFGGFEAVDHGAFVLSVTLTPGEPVANDECSGAVLVTGPTVSGTNELAFTGTGDGSCTNASKNVWYGYAAPSDGMVTASLLHNGGSADFDTALAVYRGECDALQQIACNDDFNFSTGQYESEASFPVSAGQLYSISIGGFLGDTGHFTLSLAFVPNASAPYVNPLNGHTYLLGPGPMTWEQARDHAASVGGHLVTLGDVLEGLMLQLHFSGDTPRWIGLSDEGHEGSYAWVTGEPYGYESWQAGQPDNNCGGLPENCVAVIPSTGEWIDTTNTACQLGLLRGLIEIDGPTQFASTTSVGTGCAPDSPPVLLGSLPVLGQEISLTVLDSGMLSTGVIFASAIPAAPGSFGECELQLDPATRFAVAPVSTNAIGFASAAVEVPSNPTLIGVGFALQAFLVRDADHSTAVTNGLHVVLGY